MTCLLLFLFINILSKESEEDSFNNILKEYKPKAGDSSDFYDELKNVDDDLLDDAYDRLEELEKHCFDEELCEKILYEKIKILYAKGSFDECASLCINFLEYYDESSFSLNVKKIYLFCLYDNIYSVDKGQSEIMAAYNATLHLIESGNEDKKVMEINKNLKVFVDYIPFESFYLSFDDIFFTRYLWELKRLVDSENGVDEAYYRLIEFLVNQDSSDLKEDAESLKKTLKNKYPNSEYSKKVDSL